MARARETDATPDESAEVAAETEGTSVAGPGEVLVRINPILWRWNEVEREVAGELVTFTHHAPFVAVAEARFEELGAETIGGEPILVRA